MNKYAKISVIVLSALLLGYGVGRYIQPAKVQIKREEVIREVEVVKRDVRIVEREIKRPDGTVERERIEEDRSTETVKKDTDKKDSTLIVNAKPQWKLQGFVGTDGNLASPIYGVGVERRILGPFFLGGYANTKKEFGLSVSFEF